MLVRANCARARSTFMASDPDALPRQLVLDHPALLPPPRRGRPRGEHRDAPSRHPAEIEEMDAEVGGERRRARQLEAADLADRPAAADDRERALVEVPERRFRPGRAGG